MNSFQSEYKKGIECYIDADFAGGWAQADADNTKCHVAYGICNNLCGMSCIMVQEVSNRNNFNYHKSVIYDIEQGDAWSNTFYGVDKVIIYIYLFIF